MSMCTSSHGLYSAQRGTGGGAIDAALGAGAGTATSQAAAQQRARAL